MKKLISLAVLLAAAACNQAETPAPEATESAPAEAATPTAADGGPATGKFHVTAADGTEFDVDVKPDGTYAAMDADGKVVETGKWEQKSPELYCETPDKEGAVQKCYSEKVENGVYTSTDPETGEVSTVVRVEG